MIRKKVGFEYEYLTDRNKQSLARLFGDGKELQHDYYCEHFSHRYIGDLCLEESVETRTRPMPMAAGLKHLRGFLNKMKEKRIATTEETGLHIGISTANPWLALLVDPADLILLFDDLKWLKHFNRQDVDCCKPFWYKVKGDSDRWSDPNSETYQWYRAHKGKIKSTDDFRKKIRVSDDKYSSINFAKVWDNIDGLNQATEWHVKSDMEDFKRENGYYPAPYWEIRICGGEGYEYEFKAISELIKEFSAAIDKCILNTGEKEIKQRIISLMGGEKWKGPSIPH
jgi:hypothetical protein